MQNDVAYKKMKCARQHNEVALAARNEEAKVGTIRLMPPEKNLQALKDDYDHMQNMIFGDKPKFEVILKGIGQLEIEINTQKTNLNGGKTNESNK